MSVKKTRITKKTKREIKKAVEQIPGLIFEHVRLQNQEEKPKVSVEDLYPIEAHIEEPKTECCVFGKCRECSFSKKAYPVIFLHGHDFNKGVSAFYSLNAFSELQKKLEENGYINAGEISLSTAKRKDSGMLGLSGMPVTFRASYYFDVYKTEDGETIVPSKTDSLDTYALRLKDIIRIVKYRTNKDKVIIISHSMGGLVTRKYVEVFGSADIDKIILTNTPNHGIDDNVRRYCAVIGPGAACSDMDKDSIFINKLNNAPIRDFPIYNLIGIGCSMGAETGDGIVKNSSQYLDYATNYYVTGTCDESNLEFFHETMINPNKYPETYEIISSILKNETA